MDNKSPSTELFSTLRVSSPTKPRLRRPLTFVLFGALGVAVACARDTSKLVRGHGGETGGKSSQGGDNTGGSAGEGQGGEAGSNTGGQNDSSTGVGGTTTTGVGGTTSAGVGGTTTAGAGGTTGTNTSDLSAIAETVDVGLVYAGQPTDLSLVTVGNQQFVAYWDGTTENFKALTVASRVVGSKTWEKVTLDVKTTNDGHHSIVLAADKQGYLHLSGRMHNDPLYYWRSSQPLNISTFKKQIMTGADESSCTYPKFFIGPIGDIVFSYRNGSSGDGDTIFNYYNATEQIWNRLLSSKLINGLNSATGEKNSAYIVGPVKGPDDYWHMVWTWRADANAETNHDLSYARTKDLQTWEKGDGTKLTLPITILNADIVDPVPSGGGMINNNTKVGFDSQKRPVIIYHKNDPSGFTQLYNARFENGAWVPHQTTNWSYTWAFSGMHTLVFEIEVDGVRAYPNGQLKQLYYHKQYGGWGGLLLNETTLAAVQTIAPPYPYPASLATVESTYPDMWPRWWPDSGSGPNPDIYYMLRWETLSSNFDQPRAVEPPSTMLRVYGIKRSVMALQ
jgi:hypothetical protein